MGQRWNLCPGTPESIAILGPLLPNTHSLWWMEGSCSGRRKQVESEEASTQLSGYIHPDIAPL